MSKGERWQLFEALAFFRKLNIHLHMMISSHPVINDYLRQWKPVTLEMLLAPLIKVGLPAFSLAIRNTAL